MDEQGGCGAVVAPAVPPFHQGDQARGEISPLLGQQVLMSQGPMLVGNFLDDAGINQLV